MKSITEILRKYSVDILGKNQYFYNEAISIFGKHLDKKYIDLYENYELLDFSFIDENLQTHDSKKLQDKLLKEYSNIIKEFIIVHDSKEKQSFFIKCHKDKYNEYKELKDDEKFNNILGFFNYYITGFYNINEEGDKNKFMLIEPRYSDNVRYRLEKDHIRLYHFTDAISAKRIMKTGLRCKSSKYREYPERIFLWATNERIIDKYGYLKQDIFDKVKKLVNWEDCYKYGLSCIRVDLYHRLTSNINIYSDTAMNNDEAVFIYNNVPKEFLKEIKLKS